PLETKAWAPGPTCAIPPRPAHGRPTTRLRPRHGRRPKDLTAFATARPPEVWPRVGGHPRRGPAHRRRARPRDGAVARPHHPTRRTRLVRRSRKLPLRQYPTHRATALSGCATAARARTAHAARDVRAQ